MSVEMDVGARVPGAGLAATDIEAQAAETKASWDEDLPTIVAIALGVLAASLLAVCINLS